MMELYACFNHKRLQMTVEEFNNLQQKMNLSQKSQLGNYIFITKAKSNEWIHSYKAINNLTKNYHVIKIYDLTKLVQNQVKIQSQRIRSTVTKQMLMNTECVVKCYELLENQNFIIAVMEYCNEGVLQDKIIDKKIHPLKESIEWIKEIIQGLSQLYIQNIYLENLNPNKILINDGKYKINDFQNLSRRLTMTQERLVKRHLQQLGKIFARLIFGLKRLEQDEITFITGKLEKEKILFGVNLTEDVKQFLKLTLTPENKERISWERMINLKLFHNDSKSLSNAEFLSLNTLNPQAIYKDRPQLIKNISLSANQQIILQWDKYQYIQFAKTKFILNKLIHDLDNQQTNNTRDRNILEILYLLIVRCMNNIRNILAKNYKIQESIFMKQFKKSISETEKQVTQKFYKYSAELTNKQNQKMEIGKDWLNMTKSILTFNIKAKNKRDKFLTGIQSMESIVNDYSKMEQIEFTVECINEFLQKFKILPEQKCHVYFYLLKYRELMEIRFEDLGCLMFEQYVEKRVKNELINKI